MNTVMVTPAVVAPANGDAADALIEAIKSGKKAEHGRLDELRDPWAF